MEKLTFITENNEEVLFYIIEETRVNGTDYLLVADPDDTEEEGSVFLMKDTSPEDAAEAVYEFVEDEAEMDYIGKIFEELLDDVEFENE